MPRSGFEHEREQDQHEQGERADLVGRDPRVGLDAQILPRRAASRNTDGLPPGRPHPTADDRDSATGERRRPADHVERDQHRRAGRRRPAHEVVNKIPPSRRAPRAARRAATAQRRATRSRDRRGGVTCREAGDWHPFARRPPNPSCSIASSVSALATPHRTGTRNQMYDVRVIRQHSRRRRSADAEEAIERLGVGRPPREGACRPDSPLRVSAGGLPSRSSWRAVLSSGCSTSRTPARRDRAATSSTTSCAGRQLSATVLETRRTSSTGRCSPVARSRSSAAGCRPPRSAGHPVFRDAALVAGRTCASRVHDQPDRPVRPARADPLSRSSRPRRGILTHATAGLFWITVLFCTLLAIQRAFSIESADGTATPCA